MSFKTRGTASPVYAVEPLDIMSPHYVRGPADPVYFVRGPDGEYIPLSMINPAWFVRRDGSTPLTGDWDVGGDYGLTEVPYVAFDTAFVDGVQEGRIQWNIEDGTLEFGLPGGTVNLQVGQEMVLRCRNTTGAQIDNGSVVEIIGASGNKPLIALADASDLTKVSVIGMATEDIGHNSNGYVTTSGLVREVNTNGMAIGEPVWLSPITPGTYTQTLPTAPDFKFAVGVVIAAHTSQGVLFVGGTPFFPMMLSSDVLLAAPAHDEYLAFHSGNGRFELRSTPPSTVRTSSCLATYVDIKTRNQEQHIHGNFYELSSGDALDSGTDIVVTNGIGKIVIAVLAGTDFDGTIRVTGTSVDRETGAETPADFEDIVIDALTTDGSSVDPNGNVVHDFTGAYITSKWYFGAVTISTADVTLTDVDTYGIAFEQLNDDPTVQLETIDVTMECNNSAGWADLYFYMIEVIAPKCNIGTIIDRHISVAESEADKFYRLRNDLGNAPMDGTTDGGWAELILGPLNQNYWEDINFKLWFSSLTDVVIT